MTDHRIQTDSGVRPEPGESVQLGGMPEGGIRFRHTDADGKAHTETVGPGETRDVGGVTVANTAEPFNPDHVLYAIATHSSMVNPPHVSVYATEAEAMAERDSKGTGFCGDSGILKLDTLWLRGEHVLGINWLSQQYAVREEVMGRVWLEAGKFLRSADVSYTAKQIVQKQRESMSSNPVTRKEIDALGCDLSDTMDKLSSTRAETMQLETKMDNRMRRLGARVECQAGALATQGTALTAQADRMDRLHDKVNTCERSQVWLPFVAAGMACAAFLVAMVRRGAR